MNYIQALYDTGMECDCEPCKAGRKGIGVFLMQPPLSMTVEQAHSHAAIAWGAIRAAGGETITVRRVKPVDGTAQNRVDPDVLVSSNVISMLSAITRNATRAADDKPDGAA